MAAHMGHDHRIMNGRSRRSTACDDGIVALKFTRKDKAGIITRVLSVAYTRLLLSQYTRTSVLSYARTTSAPPDTALVRVQPPGVQPTGATLGARRSRYSTTS